MEPTEVKEDPLIYSDFVFVRSLQEGSSGAVHLSRSKRDFRTIKKDQVYAIKVLLEKSRAKTEVEISLKLSHPNIVKCHAVFIDRGGSQCLVLDYCPKGDIFEVDLPSEETIVKIARDIVKALAYCHSQGITHRDIKPENILTDGDTYKLCDFGGSIHLDPGQISISTYGTEQYLAPELFKKYPYTTGVPDMWSLGCTIYELTTGLQTFRSRKHALSCIYNFPSWIKPESSVKDFISKLLVLNQNERMTAVQALEHPYLKN